MLNIIIAVILLLISILGIVLRKTYYSIPLPELKRRARQGNKTSMQLYRAVAYGGSLRVLLWVVISVFSAASFVILARFAPVWISLISVIIVLWLAFSWLPSTRVTKIGLKITLLLTPAIAWLLNLLNRPLSRSAEIATKRYITQNHTGIYEREDLLELLDIQQKQPDNRITAEEIDIAKRALHFSDHIVADVMTSQKSIKTIDADDTIGPILIDELHKSGQDAVLVKEAKNGPVIGSLELKKLGINSKGKVRDVMNPTVYFVHETDSLSEALHAFFVTNHPLFVVVNNSEEYIGIITVQSMLEQLLGHVPGDDFEQYSNPTAVAHRHDKIVSKEDEDENIDEVIEI